MHDQDASTFIHNRVNSGANYIGFIDIHV